MVLPLRRCSALDARAGVGAIDLEAGDVARKGRARRFREARELKQGYDDGLFNDGGKTLADVDDDEAGTVHLVDDEDRGEPEPWDPDEERNRRD
jgi:hypothetical protein